MKTIRDLLSLDYFKELNVVTNNDALLDKTVKSVAMTEVPDVEQFVSEGIFIFTTAMIFKSDNESLFAFLDSLKRVNAAGLGFKIGRYFQEIPQEVIEYANNINFLLIEVPSDKVLINLTSQMQNVLYGTDDISFALATQKHFTDLVLQGASIQTIINRLAETINSPVAIFNPYFSLISSSARAFPFDDIECIIEKIKHNFKSTKHLKAQLTTIFIEENKSIEFQIVPIKVYSYFYHFLLIMNPKQIPYPISEFTINQTSSVLSFALFKNLKVNETKYSLESDYFNTMISHYNSNRRNNSEQFRLNSSSGYIISSYYQVIRVNEKQSLNKQTMTNYEREINEIVTDWLRNYINNYFINAKIFSFLINNEIVILLQKQPDNLKECLSYIHRDIKEHLPVELIFSVGEPVSEWPKVKLSYAQAISISENIWPSTPLPIVNFADDYGSALLFGQLEKESVSNFCLSILKELAYPSSETLFTLRETLKVFLDSHCEISTTSNILFVHRNTVTYRIKKCEDILGFEVTHPKKSLNIRLALELSS